LTTEQAIQAGSPKMLEKASEMAEADGKPLTKRYIANVRKTHHALDRAEQAKDAKSHGVKPSGRPAKPMPAPPTSVPRKDRPVSEIRRMADVLSLGTLCGDAQKAARQFVKDIAGFDLTADEREELVESIDRTIEVWMVARGAAEKSLADEAAEYLGRQR